MRPNNLPVAYGGNVDDVAVTQNVLGDLGGVVGVLEGLPADLRNPDAQF